MLVQSKEGRAALATLDLTKPATPKIIAAYGDVDVVHAEWINDKRLVYVAREPGPRVMTDKWGTFAIDHDGECPRRSSFDPPCRLNFDPGLVAEIA